MLVEDGEEMVGMLFADVLHAKIIHYQDELDGAPIVPPQSWGSLGLAADHS